MRASRNAKKIASLWPDSPSRFATNGWSSNSTVDANSKLGKRAPHILLALRSSISAKPPCPTA